MRKAKTASWYGGGASWGGLGLDKTSQAQRTFTQKGKCLRRPCSLEGTLLKETGFVGGGHQIESYLRMSSMCHSFVYIICVYYCSKQEGDIPQSQHNYFGLVTGDGPFPPLPRKQWDNGGRKCSSSRGNIGRQTKH